MKAIIKIRTNKRGENAKKQIRLKVFYNIHKVNNKWLTKPIKDQENKRKWPVSEIE